MAGLGRRPLLSLCLASLAGLLPACDETSGRTDGGGEFGVIASCAVDQSVDTGTATPLEVDKPAQGLVCPTKDNDYYKVQHKGSLMKVELSGSVEDGGTPIQLTYLILDSSGKTVGTAPAWNGGGIRSFADFHCLGDGTYFIQVRDEGDDDKDPTNVYHLKVTSTADKDTNEPKNNNQATPVAAGQGYISCKGDLDWYSVPALGAGQMVQVTLKNTKTTMVDLKYSIWDGKIKVAEAGVPDGSKAPANLQNIHCVPKAGTYTIAVEDDKGDDSDPLTPYTIAIQVMGADPDEGSSRNDSPATAISCGAGCTKTGKIGCRGDIDYYKVDLGGVSKTNPGVIDIKMTFNGTTTMEAQVALVYGDEATPCTKDSCCRVLSGSCVNSNFDCHHRTYACVQKDEIFCSDADCKPPAGCTTQKACAGAVVCLPSGVCGGEQFAKNDDNGAKDGFMVHTAGPLLHPGPFYVRVGDLQNDEYDANLTYTVAISAQIDPDAGSEPNSAYFPYQVTEQIDTYQWHFKAARTITLPTNITGHISYPGDWDWYTFKGCAGECTLPVTFSSNCTGMQIGYQLHKSGGEKPFISFPANGLPLSGNAGCVYTNSSGTWYFGIGEVNHDAWSTSCTYTVNIGQNAGCLPPCAVESGNCTYATWAGGERLR